MHEALIESFVDKVNRYFVGLTEITQDVWNEDEKPTYRIQVTALADGVNEHDITCKGERRARQIFKKFCREYGMTVESDDGEAVPEPRADYTDNPLYGRF
jgi:hypothetical protein